MAAPGKRRTPSSRLLSVVSVIPRPFVKSEGLNDCPYSIDNRDLRDWLVEFRLFLFHPDSIEIRSAKISRGSPLNQPARGRCKELDTTQSCLGSENRGHG